MFGINCISENLRAKVSSSFKIFCCCKIQINLIVIIITQKKISVLTILGELKYKHFTFLISVTTSGVFYNTVTVLFLFVKSVFELKNCDHDFIFCM